MRFCPFCSAETHDDLAVCPACGRRLPPVPPRRTPLAQPTRIQLPLRTPNPALPPPLPRKSQPPIQQAIVLEPIATATHDPDAADPTLVRRSDVHPIVPEPPPSALQRFALGDSHAPPLPEPPPEPTPQPPKPNESTMPIEVLAWRARPGAEPPPTRILDRPFTPPKVSSVPEIPEPGLINSAKYAVRFGRARWQRRGAIKALGTEIKQDTGALDQVLGALGREARNANVEGRVLSTENTAITAAEHRVGSLGTEHAEVEARKLDENSKFVDVELERTTKLGEAERLVDEAQKELSHLEGLRRGLRDKRKELERRQKAFLRNAEDNDRQAGAQQIGDTRQELRRSAEGFRKEAAALEPERQDSDRQLAALDKPIGEATARLDAAKAELDAAKRSLNDAREGHTHRLAELDAEQKRKLREIGLAEAEIQRRLVTLGTLVNLNRIDDSRFAELYQRIDRIRGAITARTTEIEKLTAERDAYDRGVLVRGVSTIGGAIVLLIAFVVVLRAVL